MSRAKRNDEWIDGSAVYCEYIDLDHGYLFGADDWPETWTCPECGGTTFELVHADYMPSGVQPGSFTASIEEDDEP